MRLVRFKAVVLLWAGIVLFDAQAMPVGAASIGHPSMTLVAKECPRYIHRGHRGGCVRYHVACGLFDPLAADQAQSWIAPPAQMKY